MKNLFNRSRFFCLGLLALVTAQAWSADEKPNIVMILSDDQAWTDYSFMGHDLIRTPNLDRLAQSSVLYPRGYAPMALCRPSLMSLTTGHYAKDHLITGNDPSTKYAERGSPEYIELSKQLFDNIKELDTLPKVLSRNGYLTFQSGKWWEGSYQDGGFTHGMTKGSPGVKNRHGDAGLSIGRDGMEPVYEFIEIAQKEEKPFYVWYAPFLPHSPHNPPERFLERYQKMDLDPALAKYYAMCEWFDETCGELIDHLEEEGLRENTLIYYVCDNGWIQRTADSVMPEGSKNNFTTRSKLTPYDGGTRTPIMLSWPGVITPSINDDLVSTLDLMPTIISAAQAEAPEGLPGIDLMPNARYGKRIDRDIIFGDSYAHDIADLDDPEASLLYLWAIRDRWKLILSYDGEVNRYATAYPRDEAIQLFDIVADPTEQKNLAETYPEIVSQLKDEIENWYPLKKRKLIQNR